MPGLSGTGPQGMGPMSGRGMGNCNPQNSTNNQNSPMFGRGMGFGRRGSFGRGCGRGFGRGMNYSIQDEKEMLEARLDVINKNLKE